MAVVFHGTSADLALILKNKALLCGLLQEGKGGEWRKQLKNYRRGVGKEPTRRLLDVLNAGYPWHTTGGENATHVFVSPSLDIAKGMAGAKAKRGTATILEFDVPEKRFEPHPLYLVPEQRFERMIPGKLGFEHLRAVRCPAAKVPKYRQALERHGLARVRVLPL